MGRDLPRFAVILALDRIAGLSKSYLKPLTADCAYANEFPVAVKDFDVDKLRITAQAAAGPWGGGA
jgi:hypothetical protein